MDPQTKPESTPIWLRAGAAIALALFLGAGAWVFWFAVAPKAPAPEGDALPTESSGAEPMPSITHNKPIPTGVPATAPVLTKEDQARAALLDEFFRTKNDNDPRMDTELRHLSPALKEAFKAKYAALPTEARNERGTIVFLIGRDLTSAADVDFLHSVLTEAPCRGLADCGTPDRGDDHSQLASDVTLSYPQLVALKSYKKQRENAALDPALKRKIEDSLATAKGDTNPLVSRAAEEAAGEATADFEN